MATGTDFDLTVTLGAICWTRSVFGNSAAISHECVRPVIGNQKSCICASRNKPVGYTRCIGVSGRSFKIACRSPLYIAPRRDN